MLIFLDKKQRPKEVRFLFRKIVFLKKACSEELEIASKYSI